MCRQGIMLIAWLGTGLVVCANGQVEDLDKDLPLLARSAIQEMNRSIEVAKRKAVDKLQAALKAEMQAGRLDRANKVNALIAQLSALRPASVASMGRDNVSVVGEWKRRDGVAYIFRNDFTIELVTGGRVRGRSLPTKLPLSWTGWGGRRLTPLVQGFKRPVGGMGRIFVRPRRRGEICLGCMQGSAVPA